MRLGTALTDSLAHSDRQTDTELKTLVVRSVDGDAALPQVGTAGDDELKVLNGTWEAEKKILSNE